AALILALLGSIDSLLVSLVADSMTRTRHDSNRELIGQGLGNMVSGLIGGLPGTGAAMRTVINIRAGGRTRLSGTLHALILLAILLGLGPYAAKVPHAALAGILLKVGWDIVDWAYLKRMGSAPRDKLFVMIVTFVLTVFVDLITAVSVGIILASFVTARWMEREELKGVTKLALADGKNYLTKKEADLLKKVEGRVAVFQLRGSFSYASAREFANRVSAEAAGHRAIVYDFSQTAHMDTSMALTVDTLLEQAQDQHIPCFIAGVTGSTLKTLQGLKVLDRVPPGHRFPARRDAIEAAVKQVAA
ncbi:MAG: SulP family inorganic anion transporter, partial [Hyphomicrobiales bacterium]